MGNLVTLARAQKDGLASIDAFLHDPNRQVFQLEGPAGSGKSTVAACIPKLWPEPVQYVAFAAKAALRLRQLGATGARTIHSVIFDPPRVEVLTPDYQWQLKDPALLPGHRTLIIADEVSMVNEQLGSDLVGLGNKLVVIQDPYQLGPVNGDAYFRDKPDYLLTEVHRQALESRVLRLATEVREHNKIPCGVVLSSSDLLQFDICLAYTNNLRRVINEIIRQERGINSELPVPGDRVICLRNYYDYRDLLNGTILTVAHVVDDGSCLLLLLRDDDGRLVEVVSPKFGFVDGLDSTAANQLPFSLTALDFGFCITAHKAQGSEWNRVCVLNETHKIPDAETRQRWAYTAITRAAEHVEIARVA